MSLIDRRIFVVEMQDGEKWVRVDEPLCSNKVVAEWHLDLLRELQPERTFRAVPYVPEES